MWILFLGNKGLKRREKLLASEIFNRYELKFPMSFASYDKLIERIEPMLISDAYGDAHGFYPVTNLYFDTEDNFFHEQNVYREEFRQKLRLRTYEKQVTLDDTCYLEIKKKYKGRSNKRRTCITLRDAYTFLGIDGAKSEGKIQNSNDLVFQEIDYFKSFYKLKPKTIISYDRKALHGREDSDIRVTFDKNLRTRTNDLRLENGRYGDTFTPDDFVVMEVKVTNCVPKWFLDEIDKLGLVGIKFSKYSQCVANALEMNDEEN